MKKERDPTPEEFNRLLRWFHEDRNMAGENLNKIYNRLNQIFTARQCVDADELASEVINRVAVRIDSVIDTYLSAAHCCLSFVENVHREWLREQKTRKNARQPPAQRPAEELEREDTFLAKCLETLENFDRNLFVRYFAGEGRSRINARDKLAEEYQMTPNALRIKAHRVKKRMRLCIEDHLAKC